MEKHAAILVLFFLSVVPPCSRAEETKVPDKQAEYFFYRCAGCHTVGGGKLTGPDLITATQWSRADLENAIKKMVKNVGPMSEEDIAQAADFLKDPGVSARITQQKKKIEAKLRAELPPPSFQTGKRLFRGGKVLLNRGPACIGCHRFAGEGGGLGPDLSLLKDRVSGVMLQSAVENSAYKVMRPVYEKRKITKEEALHLAEYLSHPENAESRFAPTVNMVLGCSGAGFGGAFALLWFLNRRRKGLARENLFQGMNKR